jgi:hypothetical protein
MNKQGEYPNTFVFAGLARCAMRFSTTEIHFSREEQDEEYVRPAVKMAAR